MKHLLIIFSLLLTSFSCCNQTQFNNISLHNTIENYKWKKRVLLLTSTEEDTILVNEINKFFMTQKCKNDERNLELLKMKKGNGYYIKRTSHFKGKTGIWLIEYDGNIKGYSEDNTLLLNLHKLIDSMSIRKEEIKQLKTNC